MPFKRVLNKEHFREKIMQKMLVPKPVSILVNKSKQPLHTRNSFENSY